MALASSAVFNHIDAQLNQRLGIAYPQIIHLTQMRFYKMHSLKPDEKNTIGLKNIGLKQSLNTIGCAYAPEMKPWPH